MREREERRRRRQARALQLFLVASVVPATYTPPLPINTTLEHIGVPPPMVWHKTTHFIFCYFSNFYQSSGSAALNLCHGLKQFSCSSKRYGEKNVPFGALRRRSESDVVAVARESFEEMKLNHRRNIRDGNYHH